MKKGFTVSKSPERPGQKADAEQKRLEAVQKGKGNPFTRPPGSSTFTVRGASASAGHAIR